MNAISTHLTIAPWTAGQDALDCWLDVDPIDIHPPGRYEAVLTPKDASDPGAELVVGDHRLRFEAPTLEHARSAKTAKRMRGASPPPHALVARSQQGAALPARDGTACGG